jgi:hypothetical protein
MHLWVVKSTYGLILSRAPLSKLQMCYWEVRDSYRVISGLYQVYCDACLLSVVDHEN